ncbi:MAG: hybrid sensor histidine kinase/response regulator [Gemmatimonadetes bacterium]|nr:MAG: hybrid sensor histidine kinase/response regulator [Gemmatimonadota bacterium]
MSDKRKLKILVADDTPTILKMIDMRLKMTGHQVETAVNGREAVDKASTFKPDLVLLDIMMPDMSGLEALQRIKRIAPKVPIAMVSASTAKEHLKEALNGGAIGYIQKPVNFKELDNLIAEVLQQLAASEMQEKMEQMSRLAALGEISGRVAHEVLNPATAISARLEKLINEAAKSTDSRLSVIQDILQDWKKEYVNGTLLEYLNATVPGETVTHAQEDFHDLDTLLNEQMAIEQKRLEELQFLQKHLLRIIKIVDSMRGMARQKATIEEIDVNKVLKDTRELMYDTLWKRGIQVVESYDETIPKVLADANELLQVFSNITKNGADAIEMLPPDAPPREKNIYYHTSFEEGHVHIRISDLGIGIPKDKWDTIFESDYTTKDSSKGTGLGLGISRRFVRNWGGDIMVEDSVVGEGTTFLIRIPAVQ